MVNEADTCRKYILPKLKATGWEDDFIVEKMVLTLARIVPVGSQHTRKTDLRSDYVLFIRQNIPIAVVEAKAEYKNAVDCLQAKVNALRRLYVADEIGKELDESLVWAERLRGAVLKSAFDGRLV